jgi:hypothetical protein
VHCLTAMSVDLISTSMASNINPGLDTITYVWGNQCSQARPEATASILNGGLGDCLYDFCTFDFANYRFYCCIYL